MVYCPESAFSASGIGVFVGMGVGDGVGSARSSSTIGELSAVGDADASVLAHPPQSRNSTEIKIRK